MRVWGFLFSLRFLENSCLGLLQDFISLSTPSSPLKRSLFSPSFFEKTQFSSLTFLPLWPLFALFGQNVDARDIKYSRTSDISSFTHTKTHLLYYTHNVCCYSTNRVRRRPQGHQGSGAYSLLLVLSFFLILPISSSACSSHTQSARFWWRCEFSSVSNSPKTNRRLWWCAREIWSPMRAAGLTERTNENECA